MKKNIWASIRKLLKMGLLSYVLLLCSFSGITGVAVTHAMRSACILLCPQPTPTPTPAPTSTPTPTPTPAPTRPPKATPPPQVQPNPTRVVPPVSTIAAGTPTAATPTSTPASATATTVTVTPNQTATTRTDAAPANQQSQDAGDTGFNMLVLSLGVGTLIFLLCGAMIWFLWKRQKNQHEPVLQGISRSAQAPRWISSREIQSNLEVSQYASSAVFAPAVSGAYGGTGASGGGEVLPMLGSTQSMPSPQLAYTSSDSRTMMTAFPRPMLTMPSKNAVSYPQNSGLQSLLMDSPNRPLQLTEAGGSDNNGQILPLAAPLTALIDAPTIPMSSSQLELTVDPPAIKDDPMLGAVMRQAQMGLFDLSGR